MFNETWKINNIRRWAFGGRRGWKKNRKTAAKDVLVFLPEVAEPPSANISPGDPVAPAVIRNSIVISEIYLPIVNLIPASFYNCALVTLFSFICDLTTTPQGRY